MNISSIELKLKKVDKMDFKKKFIEACVKPSKYIFFHDTEAFALVGI